MVNQRNQRIVVPDKDTKDPKWVRIHLNRLYGQSFGLLSRIADLEAQISSGMVGGAAAGLTDADRQLLDALSKGSADTSVPATRPVVPVVTVLPATSTATPGELVDFGGVIYEFNGTAWVSISAAATAHAILSATHSDSLAAAVVLGDLLAGNATPKWSRLAGNITTAKQFLTQTGSGAVSAVPAWFDLFGTTNTFTAGQIISALAGLILGGGSPTFGAQARLVWAIEEITLSTVGVTTDSAANLIPADCLVLAVPHRVTQTISGGGVTGYQIGDAITPNATHFTGTDANLTAGNSNVGVAQWQGSVATDAAGPVMFATSKVRITAIGGTPTQGKIRAAVLALAFTAPTS